MTLTEKSIAAILIDGRPKERSRRSNRWCSTRFWTFGLNPTFQFIGCHLTIRYFDLEKWIVQNWRRYLVPLIKTWVNISCFVYISFNNTEKIENTASEGVAVLWRHQGKGSSSAIMTDRQILPAPLNRLSTMPDPILKVLSKFVMFKYRLSAWRYGILI